RVNRQETDHIARLLMAVDPDVCVANDQRAPRDVAEEVRRRLKFIGCDAEQSGERMLAELALAGRRLLLEVDRERRDRRRDAVHACIDRRQPHRLLGRRLDAGPGGYRLVDDAAELAAIIAATTLPRPPHAISLRTPRGSTRAAMIRESALSQATTPSIFLPGSFGFSGLMRPPLSTYATVFATWRSMSGFPECTSLRDASSAELSAIGSVIVRTVVGSSIT